MIIRSIWSSQVADWLEGYADFLELDVWTASTIKKSSWDHATKTWTVEVDREGKGTRILTVKHLVFATGLVVPSNVPDIPRKVCESVTD
jgi:cation diffusion facilitator CzcD-associated flavoprotein CzcO